LVAKGHAFLIDEKGNVLARRHMQSKNMKWYENFKKENLLKSNSMAMRHVAAKMVAGRQGVEKVSMTGEPELYVAYAPIPITRWSIGVAVKAELVTDSARKVEKAMERNIRIHRTSIKNYFEKNLKIYVITGAIILLLVMVWGLIFSRRITAPILMLKEKALRIMKGDFNSGIHLNTGDELERLDKSFDMMTHEINRYMKNAASTFREREKIEQEFAVAGNIQTLMLPTKFRETEALKIDSLLKPAREVSGDFYNYYMVDDKHLFFCLGKVSGKGVPAAMLMAQFMTLMSHLGSMKITPEKLMLMANNTLVINNKTDMAASVFCGYLNIVSGEMVYSNAEHIPALRVQQDAVWGLEMEATCSLGVEPLNETAFHCRHISLVPGDILVFTTNGIAGEINEMGEVFGEKYLLNSFAAFKDADFEALEFAMLQMKEFYGVKFEKTDVSILTIEYKGEPK
jgi:sigma-B regulation protein RsbU (phosphoserine phosphatase)